MLFIGNLQEVADKIGWFWYLLVVLVVLAGILGWIYQESKKQQKQQQKEPEKQQKEREQQEASRAPEPAKTERANNDLTRIEGIGPKVARILKDAGINSFDALAHADAAEVKNVLNEAGLQMMSPDGWIEQADLAAKEDWEGLEQLQNELKGGRRK
jgi:small subunit ribosomal protein S2